MAVVANGLLADQEEAKRSAVVAFIEIALLRVALEMVAALAATATAWQRIRRRSDAHPELIV